VPQLSRSTEYPINESTSKREEIPVKRKLSLLTLMFMILSALLTACGGTTEPAAAPAASATNTTSAAAPATDATATPAPAAPAANTSPTPEPTDTAIAGRTQLKLWTHSAGNANELTVRKQEIADFNKAQSKYQVVYEAFPQASYNDSVAAASVAKSLPCILDLDQPTVANFAWSKYIQPLPLTKDQLADFNSAAVGTYKDQVYSIGQFDVALVIYARKSVLEANNIRIPTLDKPWTLDEFNKVLDTLKASGKFENAIDVGSAGTGEWWPYAYSPMLQSFGGDLVDRKTYLTADKVLNGPEAVKWGEWFQGLFKNGYANPKPVDDQGFYQGRVALWYTGSWAADDVSKKVGADALFLPTVDFGTGPKIGGASWQWGISTACPNTDGAWEFIQTLMKPENVAAISKTTGLIPTSTAAAKLTEKYAEGGPYRIFFDMAKKFAVLRPATPGYPIISSQFEKAGLAIRDGADVQNSLDDAVDAIDRDIQDHNGYGFQQ
jgi:multiple sugar transport system substrate-binding protein